MSRVSKRDELDRYFTPDSLAQAAVSRVQEILSLDPSQTLQILEPSCGKGAFVRAARSVFPMSEITGVDVEKHDVGCDTFHQADFLQATQPGGVLADAEFDLVIGNPPFSLFEQPRALRRRFNGSADAKPVKMKRPAVWFRFVEEGLLLSRYVAMILPLASIKNSVRGDLAGWIRECRPSFFAPITPRPDFRGLEGESLAKKTAPYDVALFVWDREKLQGSPEVSWLAWEAKAKEAAASVDSEDEASEDSGASEDEAPKAPRRRVKRPA